MRKYRNGKLLIKPSKEIVRTFKQKARLIFKQGVGLRAEVTSRRLNALISGWGRYFRTAVSKEVFNALDSWLYHKVLRWGLRRVHRSYFARNDSGCFSPFKDSTPLFQLSRIPIRRHAKTPFDINTYKRDHGERLKRVLARRAALRFTNLLLAWSWGTSTAYPHA